MVQFKRKKLRNKGNVPPIVWASALCLALLLCSLLLFLDSGESGHSFQLSRIRGGSSIYPTNPPGTCIAKASDLPELWRRTLKVEKNADRFQIQNDSPWNAQEQVLAYEAGMKAFLELVQFYEQASEEDILELGTDAVNSLIDCVYAPSAGSQESTDMAVQAAIRVLKINARKYVTLEKEGWEETCKSIFSKMKYLGYAQYLLVKYPLDMQLEEIRNVLRDRVNASFRSCGSISGIFGYDVNEELKNPDNDINDVLWEWMSHSIALVDCMTVPGVQVPPGTEQFIADEWEYFKHFKFKNARDYPEGHYDHEMAYMVTHVAYIPTGYGRHVQLIHDAPWLYRYLRENFYAAMETESPDLINEFVDLVRQYGCDEEDDVMVRDGTRFLLHLFSEKGHKWMRDDDEVSNYDLIHGPWTGSSGVARRQPEPIVPGSYGHVFYETIRKFKQR